MRSSRRVPPRRHAAALSTDDLSSDETVTYTERRGRWQFRSEKWRTKQEGWKKTQDRAKSRRVHDGFSPGPAVFPALLFGPSHSGHVCCFYLSTLCWLSCFRGKLSGHTPAGGCAGRSRLFPRPWARRWKYHYCLMHGQCDARPK